jgi:hypothetical protein
MKDHMVCQKRGRILSIVAHFSPFISNLMKSDMNAKKIKRLEDLITLPT